MRKLRWKSRYQSGDAASDAHRRQLVELLNTFVDDAHTVEHCQDLTELFERIASATETSLTENTDTATLEGELQRLLKDGLPLPARGTPACTECCMCSAIEKRLSEWMARRA
jgi:hypothetical protein